MLYVKQGSCVYQLLSLLVRLDEEIKPKKSIDYEADDRFEDQIPDRPNLTQRTCNGSSRFNI